MNNTIATTVSRIVGTTAFFAALFLLVSPSSAWAAGASDHHGSSGLSALVVLAAILVLFGLFAGIRASRKRMKA